jgi:hypothetical protein
MTLEVSALALAWIAILLLALAVAGLNRQTRMLANAGSQALAMGPIRGAPAPGLRDHLDRYPGMKLLLFVDATCAACRVALEEADRLATLGTDPTFIAVFEAGTNGLRPANVNVIAEARNAFTQYNVQVRPFAVLIDAAMQVLAARPVGSREALSSFVNEARRRTTLEGGPS